MTTGNPVKVEVCSLVLVHKLFRKKFTVTNYPLARRCYYTRNLIRMCWAHGLINSVCVFIASLILMYEMAGILVFENDR